MTHAVEEGWISGSCVFGNASVGSCLEDLRGVKCSEATEADLELRALRSLEAFVFWGGSFF